MTRRRWIADEFTANTAALTGQNAAHLARVLRARVGQQFDIAAGGQVRRGTVHSVSNERVEFNLGDVIDRTPNLEITLVLAVFKFDRMEWAIEKAVELGVARIVPVVAQRTEAHLVSAANRRVERWRRIAKEAAQQSRRSSVPEIAEPIPLSKVLPMFQGARVALSEEERSVTLPAALTHATNVVLAVGPEGGWTASELAAFQQAGWTSATLGDTILRAETAAIAALAVAISTLKPLLGEEK